MAPSMLCHDQAMPSISSYSANPFRQRRINTPSRFHSKKYLWIELALPNSPFGKAFHWHPVRNTKTMPSNTLRGSMDLRPPPGRRRYFRFFPLFRFGIRGSIRTQSSLDIVHDLIALMAAIYHKAIFEVNNYLRISSKFIMPPVKTVYRQYYWRVAEKNMCVKGFKRYYADVKKELETTDIIDELYPKPEDLVIEKYWLDSFVDTPLNTFLQVLGAKYLIITGTVTDACVSATVMGAWHRSYHVVVVTDAISGVVQERNECTLKLLPVRYGKLMTTSEVIGKLKR